MTREMTVDVLKRFRESHEHPFAVEVERISDEYVDVTFHPEYEAGYVGIVANTVYLNGAEWVGEGVAGVDVDRVEIVTDEMGDVDVSVWMTDRVPDGSFEIVEEDERVEE